MVVGMDILKIDILGVKCEGSKKCECNASWGIQWHDTADATGVDRFRNLCNNHIPQIIRILTK